MSTRQQPRPLEEMLRPPTMTISEADLGSKKEKSERRRETIANLIRVAIVSVALFGWMVK